MASAAKPNPAPPQPMSASASAPTANIRPTHGKWKAAIAYLFTLISGIIVFLVAPKEDRYSRFHALQAIVIGIASVIVSIVIAPIALGLPLLATLWYAVVLVVSLAFLVAAAIGKGLRLPWVAERVEKFA